MTFFLYESSCALAPAPCGCSARDVQRQTCIGASPSWSFIPPAVQDRQGITGCRFLESGRDHTASRRSMPLPSLAAGPRSRSGRYSRSTRVSSTLVPHAPMVSPLFQRNYSLSVCIGPDAACLVRREAIGSSFQPRRAHAAGETSELKSAIPF